MMHNSWNGNNWEATWVPLYDQEFRGPFAVDAWSANRLDVFGLGKDDASMYHQSVSPLAVERESQAPLTESSSGMAVPGRAAGRTMAAYSVAILL